MDNYIDWYLTSAIKEFENKNFLQAELYLKVVLKKLPNHLIGNSLLGLLLGVQNKHEEAISFLKKAYKLSPKDPGINFNLANALLSCERHDEALIHHQLATKLNPQNAQSWLNFGISLSKVKRYQDAIKAFEKSKEINPQQFEVYISIGGALIGLEKYVEAIVNLDLAISAKSTSAEAWSNKGICLNKIGEYKKSLECHEAALELNPSYAEAWCNKGSTLHSIGRYLEATEAFKKATELKPRYEEAWSNMGGSFKELQNYDAALDCQEKAIALNSKHINAYWNKAVIKHELKKYDEAIDLYDYVNKLDPGNPERLWNKSLAQLATGNYTEGWKNYEFRKYIKNSPTASIIKFAPEPIALDQLQGKSLLVVSEQGFGDTIQFARYIPELIDRDVKVSFFVEAGLHALLSSLDGRCQLLTTYPDDESNFDFQLPLLSLPYLFNTTLDTIPSKNPYLQCDPYKKEIWHQRLENHKSPKVGIVWSGGFRPNQPETHSVNQRRNILFSKISTLKSVSHVNFYSLQKGEPAESEIAENRHLYWPENNLFLYSDDLNDFSDTAALIDNLDLVISVDTSTAHLAGALGKTVWLLNRFDTCWRWLDDRLDSPWYKNTIIYNQASPGDWDVVLDKVVKDLQELFPN